MNKPNDNKLDLSAITKNYTEDRDLKDPPSRLFRALLRKMDLNVSQLVLLLQEYMKWEVTTKDPVKMKSERNTLMGNIRAAYFKNDTMTFPKLLTGLSILQIKKYTLTLEVETEDGKTVKVSETGRVHNARNTK
ncbi:hypothetical protein FDJ25_gp006 [Vibrio phage Aphrodite1]|uniref:Uncharacterized protein n=1 Tax=Vibrio phage Aphrodite1 TaxID=2070057 RepID=A0A2I7QI49_9CAUD|nr:hypothetical protein FDJ25_gp006 [Vibrio phage Aphrodite1]AUR81070.1 hypothetical protein Aphrodite1_0204 [Vibrio phage Aphrodite1]